ncbi:DUF6197 family protein [Streptomyces nigrescens]|uniref:DUF6197 family protein n=1 Tax=Streptomyces nigrescens TaxID=1920 RepID=UPI0036FB75DD
MPDTANILRYTARIISERGLHTGPQFAHPDGSLDICAAIYLAAHGKQPDDFATDEERSTTFIECSADAMQAIQAVSASLETTPPVTEITPGHEVPNHIEHVSNWASRRTAFRRRPPTTARVMYQLNVAADAIDAQQTLAA